MVSGVGNGEAESLLKGINIPPRPTVVTGIAAERLKREPDINRISSLIATDVALSAAMLKVVNSPLYGLSRKLSSVRQAVSVLGLDNTTQLVTGLALRKTLPAGQSLDRFWDSTAEVAMISASLASRMPGIARDDAYSHGLFRDCGIPILMQKFPDYRETLHVANTTTDRKFTDVEWEKMGELVLAHLMIAEDEFQQIQKDVQEMLESGA